MVSGTLLAVVGTLAGSLIGALSSYYNNKIRQKNETKRVYGTLFAEKKANALSDLYPIIEKGYSEAEFKSSLAFENEIDDSKAEELMQVYEEFRQKSHEAEVYLDREAELALTEFRLALNAYLAYTIEKTDTETVADSKKEDVEQILSRKSVPDNLEKPEKPFREVYKAARDAVKSSITEPIEEINPK